MVNTVVVGTFLIRLYFHVGRYGESLSAKPFNSIYREPRDLVQLLQ